MKNLSLKFLAMSALLISACSPAMKEAAQVAASTDQLQQTISQQTARVSFKLTDAPNKQLNSVVVDVDHMEVLLAGEGKAGRLIVAKDLGPVDLLKLQNGVTLPLQDVVVPHGLRIQQIRLVLKSEGHYAVKSDSSLCELKTPSAEKTGVKIILTHKVQFEAGHVYDVLLDFDALSSVVVQGNGRCLLKPVLKLKSVTKTRMGEETGDGTVSKGPGEVLLPDVEVNDPADDGWDYTPVQDGDYPVLTQDQLSQLL